MTDREYLLKLMYAAFLDIRIASYSQDSHTCFMLSDIFHNVPLQMNQADKGMMSFADIVTWIQEKCEESANPGLITLPPTLQHCPNCPPACHSSDISTVTKIY